MKKFLFTLAALLMVGTAYADNYLYIEDFEVTPEFLAQTSGKAREMTLDVKAHYDQYVSAFMVWINSPEGITNRDALAGAAMTQSGYTRTGNPIDRQVALSVSENVNIFIAAWTEADFYYPEGLDPDEDDPVSVGSVKWAPGDYAQMFTLTVRFAQDFAGGDIMVITEPAASGTDPRGDVCPKDEHWEHACHVTVAGAPTPEPAPVPTIEFAEDASGVMITIDNYTEYTITVDGVQVDPTREAHPYYVEKVYDKAQDIVVYAKNDPGDPYTASEETKTYNLPAKVKEQNSTPSVTYSYNPETGELNVWAYGCTEADVEYMLYCDGVAYNGTFPIAVVAEDGYNHTWTATAVSPTTTVSAESAPCEIVIDPVIPTPTTPDPTITVVTDTENEKVIITVEGQGTVTATVTYADGPVTYTDEDGDGKIVIEIPFGDAVSFVNVVATAQNPGATAGGANEPLVEIPAATPQTEKPVITSSNDDAAQQTTITATGNGHICLYNDDVLVAEGEGTATWTVPYSADPEGEEYGMSATAQEPGKKVSEPALATIEVPGKQQELETCVAPNGDYVIIDKEKALVTITNNEPGATVHYVVTLNGVVQAEGDFTGETWEYVAAGVGDWVVSCVASLPGKNDSQPGGVFFPIAENQWPTAVDEMMAGKTISNVRYFNVAGQEMEEANGMTIVVTTYTDGTKSAVKVMK